LEAGRRHELEAGGDGDGDAAGSGVDAGAGLAAGAGVVPRTGIGVDPGFGVGAGVESVGVSFGAVRPSSSGSWQPTRTTIATAATGNRALAGHIFTPNTLKQLQKYEANLL
jgi:hypothetical protein